MRTRTTLAVIGPLLLALTGCSGSGEDAKPKAKAPAAKAPTPTSTPTEAASLAFGQAIDVKDDSDGTHATMTVLRYEQGNIKPQASADEEFGTKGYVWAALELKFCSKKGTSGITRYPWALAYADGARIQPSTITYGDFPKPEYPYEAMVRAGDCVRGKTVFAVPGDQRPQRVLYTTELFATPPEWTVPKS